MGISPEDLKGRVGTWAYIISGFRAMRGRRARVSIAIDGAPPLRRSTRMVARGRRQSNPMARTRASTFRPARAPRATGPATPRVAACSPASQARGPCPKLRSTRPLALMRQLQDQVDEYYGQLERSHSTAEIEMTLRDAALDDKPKH